MLRNGRAAIWIAAGALSLLSAASSYGQDLAKVTVRLSWIAGGVDAPILVAKEKGFFKDEGLDVTIVDGTGSTASIQLLMSKSFDFAEAGIGALAQAEQQSADSSLIAIAGLIQKDPTSVISLKGSGITKPKDIEGKRFGTDSGNLEDGMIKAFADANGVDFSKVKILIVANGNDRVALLKGDVDFINGWANPDGDKVAAYKPIEPPLLFADYGVNILGTGVVTRKDYLASHGDIAKKLLKGLQRGKEAVAADPAEALKLIMAARPDSDPKIIEHDLQVMPKYEHTAATAGKPYGYVADSDVQQTISLLEKYDGMKSGLKISDIYTADYLPK